MLCCATFKNLAILCCMVLREQYLGISFTCPSHTLLDPRMLWAHCFLEILGWCAEKLHVTLRHQVFGEPVPSNGSRNPSFRSICVCDGCVPYFILVLSFLWLVCCFGKNVFYERCIGCDSLL